MPVSWQVAQVIDATGAWFIAVPPKLAKFDAEWQLSQAAVPIGRWFEGGVFIVTPKNADPVAWHCAQPEVIPAWFIAVPEKVVKFDAAWQVSQALAVGMWLAGGSFGTMLAKLRPAPWHVAQPFVMPVWFITATE